MCHSLDDCGGSEEAQHASSGLGTGGAEVDMSRWESGAHAEPGSRGLCFALLSEIPLGQGTSG